MHDVQVILEKVGSERAILFGASEGGPCLQSTLRPSSYVVLETTARDQARARSSFWQQLRCPTGGVS